MFWIRKPKKIKILGQYIEDIPTPPKKEFTTMLDLLRDAEKYDFENEIECRNALFDALCDRIETFKKLKTK